ncbi:MAG: LPS ABC transporter substrate-binding protein LptA [Bradyrhizobiaceae bacterium]|nr:MAG: LPS ABC transporter substrate-binding protein LptA [Bradyrhizobiaceae bacterium]
MTVPSIQSAIRFKGGRNPTAFARSAARILCRAGIFVVAISAAAGAHAQTSTMTGVPNAMQGFSQNRDKPIQIDALSLEMRDKDKAATFSGNVKVVQGDTTMRAQSLVVYYDQDPKAPKSGAMKSATPGPGGASSIRRLEAKGGVTVTQKDQTVTGQTGVFDMRANTVTMLGGVVLTKDKNVLRGDRLIVDMTTGVSRVESEGGRGVQGMFQSSTQGGGPAGFVPNGASGGGASRETPSQPAAAGKPLKLNSLQQVSPPRG